MNNIFPIAKTVSELPPQTSLKRRVLAYLDKRTAHQAHKIETAENQRQIDVAHERLDEIEWIREHVEGLE